MRDVLIRGRRLTRDDLVERAPPHLHDTTRSLTWGGGEHVTEAMSGALAGGAREVHRRPFGRSHAHEISTVSAECFWPLATGVWPRFIIVAGF